MLKMPLCLIVLLSLLPRPALAVDESADAEIIALEIRNLSTSVDRLTRLLYDQSQQKQQDAVLRKLDIAVAYLNFRSRRIETLERDKQRANSTRTRFEDVIRQWEQRLEALEEQAANDPGNTQSDLSRDEVVDQIKMLKQRLARVDNEILDYDNRIIELQGQLDSVEGFVERHLELE